MALNFENELRDCGCALSREQFFELVEETRFNMFPAWSQDELACHPSQAVRYCETVRQRAGAPVPEHVTMHAMFAARKRP